METLGQFDSEFEQYTTAKGVVLTNTLIHNPLSPLLHNRQIACPTWIPGCTIPSPLILLETSQHMLQRLAERNYHFRDTPKFKSYRGNWFLYAYYYILAHHPEISFDPEVIQSLKGKAGRSDSGVIVNTITLSPYPYGKKGGDGEALNSFSCRYNCSFCPNQPGVPRSYLAEEPAVMRGIAHGYHPVLQTFNRLSVLFFMGHKIDKIEVKFIGGTWNSYTIMYRKWVVYQTFRVHNHFFDPDYQLDQEEFHPDQFTEEQLDQLIQQEQIINQTASCRIIGLTVETRPDCINRPEIRLLRQLGCTRVEMGAQHTCDEILRINNRGHLAIHTKRAIRMLKNNGFKIVIHLMPQLPGSNPQLDREMLTTVIKDPDWQADEWKLYNTEVVPYTQIQRWYEDGTYLPYPEEELRSVYQDCLPNVPEYIRIDRLKRDIPSQYTIAGVKDGGFRNTVFADLDGKCHEIRSREIRQHPLGSSTYIQVLPYHASDGREFHLMIKTLTSEGERLCGFCRLRLPSLETKFDLLELNQFGALALIRELHVYGTMTPVKQAGEQSQHRGFGKTLVRKAEEIAFANGYLHLAIIAGVGTREYYANKLGYRLEGTYMVKQLTESAIKEPNINEPNNSVSDYYQLTRCLVCFYLMYMLAIGWFYFDLKEKLEQLD